MPQLSAELMRRKIENDQLEQAQHAKFQRQLRAQASRLGGDLEKATIKIQSRVRGRVARANVLGDFAYFLGGFIFATRDELRSKVGDAMG